MAVVLLKIDKTLRCGCNPGVGTQPSLIPFRHKHVPVAFPEGHWITRSGYGETIPAPPRTRIAGGRASRWAQWLERHRLVAFPKELPRLSGRSE